MSDLASESDRRLLRVLEFFRSKDRGAAGGLSKQWMDAIHADPALTSAVLTVDLVLGQDTHVRLATKALEVVSLLTGERLAYLPELTQEPSLTRSYRPGDPSAEVESVSIQLSNRLIKAREIVASGRLLAGYGELALQIPGGGYEERLVLLRGEMTGGVVFGSDEELIEVEIADPKITSDLVVPPWVASTERHPLLPEGWTGERYPLVFNGALNIEAVRVTTATGWPSASWPSWLCCYGHDTSVAEVMVNGEPKASGSADYPWAEVDAVDLLGAPYKEVAFLASATTWEDSDAVHVSLSADESLHLIEILERLIGQFSVLGVSGCHQPLFARARGLLPNLRPFVVINASNAADEAGVLSFIEGTLLASYPMISMVWQNGRYGPVVTDYRTRKPVAELEAGVYPMISRVSQVQEIEKEQLFNSFSIRYGWDPLTNAYTGVATRNPSNDLGCRLSRDMVGERAFNTVESPFIQTEAEAEYVIDWQVAHLSVPSYYVEWSAFPWVLLAISRGDSVWFSDPEFGWVAERSVVQSITRAEGGGVVIGLRVWPGSGRLHTARS